MATSKGRIILLNGASSSGKSSLARAVRTKIDAPFWHISIDHLRDAGVLPMDRVASGEFSWSILREPFFIGFERSLAAYASAGNDLIVEYIVETPQWMDRLARTLADYDLFFVGLHCDLDELERRELARGDRPLGGARRDFFMIHNHCHYDLELDGSQPLDDNAERLISAWRNRSPRPLHQSERGRAPL